MSEAKEIVEAAGVEVAKFAIDKLDSYFMAAQEVITKYGGDAVDLGLMALRVDAASQLILPFILALVFSFVAVKLYRAQDSLGGRYWDKATVAAAVAKDYNSKTHADLTICRSLFGCGTTNKLPSGWDDMPDKIEKADQWPEIRVFLAAMSAVFSTMTVFSIGQLVNIWAWAGIFYPEVYAVHKFLL